MSNKATYLIQSRVSLAPMAGITDYVLRSLVRRYSKSCLLTTEMISSEYLAQTLNGRGGIEILKRDNNHSPISYQISGHKPEMIHNAAKFLSDYADMIDINMGCPVKKVVGGQDGASLMLNQDLAQDLVRAAKDGTDKPVSVKFRLGYTAENLNYVEFGQAMQSAGADFITIHARTRSQMYSGHADWGKIKKLKENVDIPVFANGDVDSVEKAIECFEMSKADGIAIGRGVLGDPELIFRIENYLRTGKILPPPTIEEKIKILKKHIDEELELRGENVGIKFMRKFYPYYLSGFENAKTLRSKLVIENDYNNIINLLNSCVYTL